MSLFKPSQHDKVISLLKKTRPGFNFKYDQENGRLRLMEAIKDRPQEPEQSLWRNPLMSVSLSLLALVLVITGTFSASASSLPGDKLFSLYKMKEKILLILSPDPMSQAEIQASIVEDRLEALDLLPEQSTVPLPQLEVRQLETLKEAEASLNHAVESIQKSRDAAIKKGEEKQAEKLDNVLSNISDLSEKREKVVEEIEKQVKDQWGRNSNKDSRQEKFQEYLDELKKAREKARLLKKERRND